MAKKYDKLWKILNNKKMMKKDLVAEVGISTNVIVNMGKGKEKFYEKYPN